MEDQPITGGPQHQVMDSMTTGNSADVLEQPDTVEQTPAEETTEDTTTELTDNLEEDDEDLDYLRKKGIDPKDPEATRKVAKMYRNAEQRMTKSGQAANELRRMLEVPAPQMQAPQPTYYQPDPVFNPNTGLYEQQPQAPYYPPAPDPAMLQMQAQLANQQTDIQVNNLYIQHPEARTPEYHEMITSILQDRPNLRYDLEAVFDIADARISKAQNQNIETRVRKQTTQALASKQRASTAPRNAQVPVETNPKWTASRIEALSPEEYKAKAQEIQAAINSGQYDPNI